ncbi:copper amine oxidase N-terminal domain-containing protein [Paenibacillus sp. FSL W8-0426]|uniref:copper amine oxidase N-terminal domain-containing protein n=1 Tax=Paenibacillus sp. FSL W8-0426 TaxID=2921714 RepID=UPI0030D7BD52
MKKAGGNQVKKVMSALAVSAMLMSALPAPAIDAAAPISIYINDSALKAPQPPVMKAGRVLVPLRSIFEGLDANVQYTNKTKTIKATRGDQEVILKLGSKTAYINGELTYLDVPASTIKGNTMVPIRFVSEAFGEKVYWNSRMQRVDIKTTTTPPPVDNTSYAAWNIYGTVSGNNGDGRDVTVSFTRPASENGVSEYRVMLVKTRDVNSFNESAATAVPSSNYTRVVPNGTNPKLTLNAQTRDVNGDLLSTTETYRLYVLTVGGSGNNYKNALAWSSQALKLSSVKTEVQAVNSLKIADVSDYGDGRDLEISFNQPSNTSNITYYRAFVVKAKDASSFNLAAANKVSSSNSTIIYKNNTTSVTSKLSSTSRDTSGELIKNGTSYVVYIMSVSANTASAESKLSTVSSSLTLGANTAAAPVITQVLDNSDYGDGRDIRVSFNRVSDESKVGSYRIFVVRNSVAGSFNLTTASNLSSSLYYQVNKTGGNITVSLPSNMRDTSGYSVTNLQDYRIYVMAVGNQQNNYTNALSSSSSVLRLATNANAPAVTNVAVADVSDYGDGRDLRVSFNRPSSEDNIASYRIYVVRNGNTGSFNLSAANASNNYIQVNKTGGNQSLTLPYYAVDTNGYTLTNGVSYRVFVMSVSTSGNTSQNALSSSSASITLSQNSAIAAPTNVVASDVGDSGNGSDLQVSFTRSVDETNVNHYRVFVVKADRAGSFNLSTANAINSANYTYVSKTGNNPTLKLSGTARDTDGQAIRNDVSYRVFVLAVNTNTSIANALSSGSTALTLTSVKAVSPATNVNVTVKNTGQAGNASDVTFNFSKPADESGISGYKAFIVPAGQVSSFNVASAERIGSYVDIAKSNAGSAIQLNSGHVDINGGTLVPGTKYNIFVMSVADSPARTSVLSAPSQEFTILAKAAEPVVADKVSGVSATVNNATTSIDVSFNRATNQTGISRYDVYLVRQGDTLNLGNTNIAGAVQTNSENPAFNITSSMKDSEGRPIEAGKSYSVYVVSVANGQAATVSSISSPSNSVQFPSAPANPAGSGNSDSPAPAITPPATAAPESGTP